MPQLSTRITLLYPYKNLSQTFEFYTLGSIIHISAWEPVELNVNLCCQCNSVYFSGWCIVYKLVKCLFQFSWYLRYHCYHDIQVMVKMHEINSQHSQQPRIFFCDWGPRAMFLTLHCKTWLKPMTQIFRNASEQLSELAVFKYQILYS